MSSWGMKVSKPGKEVRALLTEANKKDFQLLSTEGALLEKTRGGTASTTNMFLGYRLITERGGSPLSEENIEVRPLNYYKWGETIETVYITYENEMP